MTTTRKKSKKQPKSPAESAAYCLGHWIRVEALTILVGEVASPKQIAEAIGDEVSVQLVSYHIRILDEQQAVELVKTEKRGSVDERFYRATMRPELSHDEWLELSPRHKQELAIISIRDLFAENLSSVESGEMTADDKIHYWWKSVLLDGESRDEVRQEQERHTARLLEIEAKANARAIESRGTLQQTPTVLAALAFNRGQSGRAKSITT